MNTTASTPERPTFGEMIAGIVPLLGAVAGYGPPVISLAGPWLLVGLMLAGPAFLLTLVAVMVVAATVVVALSAAILAAPYLLVGRLRSFRARRVFRHDRAPQLATLASTRVAT